MIQITTKSSNKIKTNPESDIMKISFSISESPLIRFSLLTPGGYDESGFPDVISAIVVVGIISEGKMTEMVADEVVVVSVVEVVVGSGMKSLSIFIFAFYFF